MERTFSYFFVGIDDLEEDANQMKDDLEGESQVTRLRTKLSSAKTTLDLRLLFNISTPGWLVHPPLPSFQSAFIQDSLCPQLWRQIVPTHPHLQGGQVNEIVLAVVLIVITWF